MTLDSAELALATEIGFETEICELVKHHSPGPLKRLSAVTEEYDWEPGIGLSIAADRQTALASVTELRPLLIPQGYCAFWSKILDPNGLEASDEIAILKTTDQYDIVRIRRSQGGNYGIFTDDVLAKLKEWESICSFRIFGASTDWVAIQFESLPTEICRFAEDVFLFCPDTVEQGVGLMNERDDPEMFAAAQLLCPELSAEIQRKLEDDRIRIEKMDLPEELRALRETIARSGFGTSPEMGIRLLAYELKRTNELFLWWD